VNFYQVFCAPSEPKGKRRIALHWKTFYSKWALLDRRKGSEQFKSATLLSYIKEEPYFIKAQMPKRIGSSKKNTRCLVLSLDPIDNPPPGLLTWTDGDVEDVDGEQVDIVSLGNTDTLEKADGELPFAASGEPPF
jgi:hypothetical protein